MNQTKIQILSCEPKSGVSKKNGQPWSMFVCQAVTHGTHEDGTSKVLVGELILPVACLLCSPACTSAALKLPLILKPSVSEAS